MSGPILDSWTSKDGNHQIILGDCLQILPTLDTSEVAAVLADPPYGIGGYVSTPSKWRRQAGHVSEAWDDSVVDLQPLLGFERVIIWGGNNYGLPPSRNFICWYKPDAPPSMAQCEYAWCNWDGNAKHITQSISATTRERNGHPTQKPLRVILASLEHADRQVILDPYAGSCTVAVACARTGRRSISIEIEERYFRIGIERMEREAARTPLFEPKKEKKQVSFL